jgi:SpoIVB peptidase S55
MSSARRSVLRSRRLLAGICSSALAVSLLSAPAPAPAAVDCTAPPSIMPTSQLVPGMTGSGVTTLEGTTPTTFDVEVLGVMKDYIWLGVDAIVVRITGPQSFLDETGGVFYGMSGSPVSVNGKLIGSVSYGVSFDPTIVGLTPAQAMIDLFGRQDSTGSVRMPRHISFDQATRQRIAAATGVSPSAVTGGMEQLPSFVAVSGLSGAKLAELQKRLDKRGSGMQVVPGSGMEASLPVNPQPFTAGQPIASVLSWGDFTVWAAGTVAVVCGSELVAYGHSLFGYPPGELEIGMTGATVLAVGNGHGIWPGDMVPALTEPRGTFRLDGFAGEAGFVGQEPSSTPITSSITSLDTGTSRDGRTDSIFGGDFWFGYQVWGHHVLNFGAVQQALGPGTSRLSYTIEGTRKNGTPFTISNRTMVASTYDATESVYKLSSAVDQLMFNRFQPVEITSIDSTGEITADQLIGTITKVRTSSPLDPSLRRRYVVDARPGDLVTAEVTMTSPDGGTTVQTMKIRVPQFGRFETVRIRGGRERWYARADSLGELLRKLSGGEHYDDLVVTAFGRKQTTQQPVVVSGRASFNIRVVR